MLRICWNDFSLRLLLHFRLLLLSLLSCFRFWLAQFFKEFLLLLLVASPVFLNVLVFFKMNKFISAFKLISTDHACIYNGLLMHGSRIYRLSIVTLGHFVPRSRYAKVSVHIHSCWVEVLLHGHLLMVLEIVLAFIEFFITVAITLGAMGRLGNLLWYYMSKHARIVAAGCSIVDSWRFDFSE